MSGRNERALRLHLNEHTAGCSAAVLDAIRGLDAGSIATYPDYAAATAAAARFLNVPPEWVVLTNGLDEGLHVAAQHARLRRDALGSRSANTHDVVIVEPAFEMYAFFAQTNGLRAKHVSPEPDLKFPSTALLDAIDETTQLVYLTDPNNPTGMGLPRGIGEQVLERLTNGLLLLDEAYADFSRRTMIGALERHRRLVIGRTFAKAHGLAGLRIGALVAHPDTLAPLRALVPVFNVNTVAAHVLPAALDDRAFLESYVAESERSRELIYSWSRQRGFLSWPSEANFVLVRIGAPTAPVVSALAEHGILIRDRGTAPGCDGCIRITAGILDHTRLCLTALEAALAARAR